MVAPGVCIAATGSGMGKTTIATGLIAALARRMRVAPFKVGPDYIDPGYHTLAARRQGRNLDAVMCGTGAIGPLYAHGCSGAEIGVVEGVMGLFDGRINDGAGSTADVAAALGIPVILIVDVRGLILVGDIFKSLKPDEINGSGVVRKFTDQSFFASFSDRIEKDDPSFELDIRHVARDLADPVEPATVNMFVRKIVQQIFERDHVDLFLQEFGTFRPYSRKIHDVTFADRHVHYKL